MRTILTFEPRAVTSHGEDFTALLFSVISLPGDAGSDYISAVVSARPSTGLMLDLPVCAVYDLASKAACIDCKSFQCLADSVLFDRMRATFSHNRSHFYRCIIQLFASITRSIPNDEAYSSFVQRVLASAKVHLEDYVNVTTVPALKSLVAYM
jgi:hypothetical protein